MKRSLISIVAVLAIAGGSARAQVPEEAAKASAELAARQAEAIARAQQKVAQEAEAARQKDEAERTARDAEIERIRDLVFPLDVQVTVSRYQGEKKVSSLPYQLSVNAVHRDARPIQFPNASDPGASRVTSVRMGAQIPLPTMSAPTVDGKPVAGVMQVNPVQYRDIGTAIDASATHRGDASGFDVAVTVEDTSLYNPKTDAQASGSGIDTLPVLRTFRSSNHMLLKDGQTRQFTMAADRVSGETLRVDVTLKIAK
jgi:hypothetical protein